MKDCALPAEGHSQIGRLRSITGPHYRAAFAIAHFYRGEVTERRLCLKSRETIDTREKSGDVIYCKHRSKLRTTWGVR